MIYRVSKAQQAQARSLMKDARWEAVIRFSALKLEQWKSERVTGATAFEELRAMHTRDGKVEGLVEFLDQMERQAFEDN